MPRRTHGSSPTPRDIIASCISATSKPGTCGIRTCSRPWKHLLDRQGERAKAVVWAHNSHIGAAAATEMGWRGELNLGQLCRERFGAAARLIGFGTDRGTVAAASDWDGDTEVKRVRPAME